MAWRTPSGYLRGLRNSPLPRRQTVLVPRPFALRPCRTLIPRTYSTVPEAESQSTRIPDAAPDKPPAGDANAEAPAEPVDPLQKELEEKKREIIDLKDRYLRSVADFRNLQDRTARDVAAARDFAITRFAKDLLDSVDNLDRALLTVPEAQLQPQAKETGNEGAQASNKDLINLHDGLQMTEKILLQTLAKHGLERFDPAENGEPFNPNLHEASFMAPMEGKQDGTVFSTMQKGFKLNGRVIRAAKVGVVKNS